MAVKIWDNGAGAFRNADTPKRYDAAAGAWVETTGRAWNPDVQAWEKKWNNEYYLIKDGVAQNGVALAISGNRMMGTDYHGYPTGKSIRQGQGGFAVFSIGGSTATGAGGGCNVATKVDVTPYSELRFRGVYRINNRETLTMEGCNCGIMVKGSPTGENDAGTWKYGNDGVIFESSDGRDGIIDISSYTGHQYIGFSSWNTHLFPAYFYVRDLWLE